MDNKPMDSSFRKIGHLTLNREMISRQKFLLVDVAYPLDGCIILNIKCFPEVVEQTCQIYRNFMSVYQMVDGYGSWPRFWCVLGNFQLKFYRYPEDEDVKVWIDHWLVTVLILVLFVTFRKDYLLYDCMHKKDTNFLLKIRNPSAFAIWHGISRTIGQDNT